mmetsp:Transcript_20033/g.28375  ORF Transcript_20033/g.28375 Transcript_20033/m.28375 type:complete len:475 (-) Transcript_20033:56-1480(-)
MMLARTIIRYAGLDSLKTQSFARTALVRSEPQTQAKRLLSTDKTRSGGGAKNSKTLPFSFEQFGLVGGVVAVLSGAITARLLYSQLLNENNAKSGPRRDASRATVLIQTPVIDKLSGDGDEKITLERLSSSGHRKWHEVDASEFATFVAKQRTMLLSSKKRSQDAAAENLHKELSEAFADASDRVKAFSNWYFAYSTTYRLLGIAMTSAAKHAVTFRTEKTLSTAVSDDLQAHVRRKYEALVLRPALTDPKVHRAFMRSLRMAHNDYLQSMAELEDTVASFVVSQSKSFAKPPRSNDVEVALDWSAQQQKVEHLPLAYEKNPEITIALIGAGTAAGKIAGGAAVGGAAKALAAKIVAPFATKAVGATLGKGVAAGAVAGGAMVGPVGAAAGAAAGAAIGLGVDMSVNAGVALMQSSAFEKDVRDSLDATVLEWEERLLPELERVQGIWFDHAEGLLQLQNNSSENGRRLDEEEI